MRKSLVGLLIVIFGFLGATQASAKTVTIPSYSNATWNCATNGPYYFVSISSVRLTNGRYLTEMYYQNEWDVWPYNGGILRFNGVTFYNYISAPVVVNASCQLF